MNAQEYAMLIKRTAEIHQGSYDHAAADEAVKEDDIRNVALPVNNIYRNVCGVDFSKFYTLTLQEAAEAACKERSEDQALAYPIYLALQYTWNDMLDWADEVLGIVQPNRYNHPDAGEPVESPSVPI